MSYLDHHPSQSSQQRIVDVIASVTRYPREYLGTASDLEDDLGIDSVKRTEIAARLATEFSLDTTVLESLNQARTIEALADALARLTSGSAEASASEEPTNVARPAIEPPSSHHLPASGGPLQTLQQIVAQVTRYPQHLLADDADLEGDLGIDSVKLEEILVRIRERFPGLELSPQMRSQMRTLRELADWIEKRVPIGADSTGAPSSDAASHQAASGRYFEGKIALISGSGHGLGRVTALELARQGASVIINSFHNREIGERTVQWLRNEGARAKHIWASMAKRDHVERLFGEIGEHFGGLDFFIHNASSGVFAKLPQVTEEHWLKSFRTNILGFHQGALRAAELMRARGGGKILTLSSVYENATMDYFGVQGPIKAGLESLTRFMAKELFDDNIQVNCASFAALEGQAMTLYPEAERFRIMTEQRSQGRRRMTELEAARAQLLLLRQEADSLTGSVIRIDRGMMLWSDV